eukprot:gene5628-biopygen2675
MVRSRDARRHTPLKYTQRFKENMSRTLHPTISPVPARTRNPKQFVSVRFLPDYKRFGGLQSLPEDILKVMERRAYNIAALTPTRVTVTFNDHIFPSGRSAVRQHTSNTSTKIGRSLKQSVVKPVRQREPFLFVRATIPNPTFDSQAKNSSLHRRHVSEDEQEIIIHSISERFIGRLCKLDGFVERVSALSGVATERDTRKTDGAKRSVVYGVKKLDDAEWAGTAKSMQSPHPHGGG